jgi:hypothetical protein
MRSVEYERLTRDLVGYGRVRLPGLRHNAAVSLVRRLRRESALEFGGSADRGDGGVDQVADEGVALVVGGSESAG